MLPSRIALDPGPLPSTGITRLPRYYGPLRHPAGPDWPSRVSGGRVHATDRASRVAAFFIFHACWRHYPGRYRSVHRSLASQSANGLPLINGGSASALTVSRPAQRSLRVPARMVAEPPYAALRHQSASVYIVASVNRPGCYQPERQLLGGVRTRQKKAPFHGARRSAVLEEYRAPRLQGSEGGSVPRLGQYRSEGRPLQGAAGPGPRHALACREGNRPGNRRARSEVRNRRSVRQPGLYQAHHRQLGKCETIGLRGRFHMRPEFAESQVHLPNRLRRTGSESRLSPRQPFRRSGHAGHL